MNQKTKLLTCKNPSCNRKFTPRYWNGILQSKYCPGCALNRLKGNGRVNDKVSPGIAKISNVINSQKKSTPRQKAMKLADDWFSRFIRIKYAAFIQNGEVFCKCIVTGKFYNAKNMDNGHCHSRDRKSIRYWEDNCRPQNRSSNRFRGEADHDKFVENLIKEIGQERYDKLIEKKEEDVNDNEQFYKGNATKYRKLVNELVKKNDIIKWW